MRLPPPLTTGALAQLLTTGGTWSTMAGCAGFDTGTAFRAYCISRGLRRKIRGNEIIVVAEPVGQRGP